MDAYLGINYILVNSENFEDYLIFIGIGYLARKVALTLKQIVRLTCNEESIYKFEFISPLASTTTVFTSGEEFEETKPDGVKVTSVITIEGNIMTHIQTDKNGRISKHVREFSAEKMTTVTTAEGLNKIVTRNYVAE